MQQGRFDHHSQDNSRLENGSGSSSRLRSPVETTRLQRNRSPSQHNHPRSDRHAPTSDEQRRLQRNRVDKVEAVDEDGKYFDSIQTQIKEVQAQNLERDRQKHRSKEHKTNPSRIRELSPVDRLELLSKKSLPSLKENGSSKETSSKEYRNSSGWKNEIGRSSEDNRYPSSIGKSNGRDHSRSYKDEDARENDSYRRRESSSSRRHNDERRDSRGYRDKEERRGSRSDPRSNDHSYEDNREYESRSDDRRSYDHPRRSSDSRQDHRRRDRDERRDSHSHRDRQEEARHEERRKDSQSRQDDHREKKSRDDAHQNSHSSVRQSSYIPIDGDKTSGARSEKSSQSEKPPEKIREPPYAPPAASPLETNPAKPPPPPTPPRVMSFKAIKLPHELLEPENAALIPKVNGKELMPFRVTVHLEIVKDEEKGEIVKTVPVKEMKVDGKDVDPRVKTKERRLRDKFRIVKYKWDSHSVKSPSCAVLVTGATPMMTIAKLKFHFQTFGKIVEIDQKHDQLGQSLGLFYIRYMQDYTEASKLKPDVKEGSNQRGDLIALKAVSESRGKVIYNEFVNVSLDDDNKTQFLKIFEEELARITALKTKKVEPIPVAPITNLPSGPSVNGLNMRPPTGPRALRNESTSFSGISSPTVATQNNLPVAVIPSTSTSAVAPKIRLSNIAQQQPRPHYSTNQYQQRTNYSNGQAQQRTNYPDAQGTDNGHANTWYNSAYTSPTKTHPKRPTKTSWSEQELFADSKLLILRELGESFMRDLKTRTINSFLKEFIKPEAVGGQAIRPPALAEVEAEADESESEVEIKRPKGRRRKVVEEERGRVDFTPDSTEVSEKSPSDDESDLIVAVESTVGEVDKEVKKMGKKMKKTKMARADDIEEVVAEDETPAIDRPKAKKSTIKKISEQTPAMDPVSLGLAEDEEDLYYLKVALEKAKSGMSLTEIEAEEMKAIEIAADIESGGIGVNGLPRHASGSARTDGVYRIAPAEKAVHMPDRNRAVVDPSSVVGFTSARGNRADSRRFVQGIEQHKKETATDTDILKFNQLRSRKKQLKFSKSPIHDWGLYAVELIPAGDMVIEYVGEIVRQQVADQREKMYERQGNFSTYLFRVDDDVVVDATKKGNIARLMNHCCTPNCSAKILTLNGEKRIVIFAQKPILPGQELTYDYKFQATGDEEDAIACLCGSPGCRRFL